MKINKNDNKIQLDIGNFIIQLDKNKGLFEKIVLKGKNIDLLNGEIGYISLYYKVKNKLVFKPDDVSIKEMVEQDTCFKMILQSTKIDTLLEITFKEEEDRLRLSCTAIAFHDELREVEIVYLLPIFNYDINAFLPYSQSIFAPNEIDQKTVIYGMDQFRGETSNGIALPLNGFFNDEKDYGISIIAPVELRKPQIQYNYLRFNSPISFVAKYCNLRLSKNFKANSEFIFVSHEGDWRCCLNAIYSLYQEYFDVPHTSIYEHEGTMICSDIQPEENIKSFSENQGLKWQEIHANVFPYYGMYSPEEEEWDNISHTYDASKYTIDTLMQIEFDAMDYATMRKANPEKISRKGLNDYIDLLHKYDVASYMYMNAIIYSKWEKYKFEDSYALGLDGEPCFKNHWMNVPMNPDFSTSFGKDILNQVRRIFDLFPKVDGLFYDELHFRMFDMNHDDGITCLQDKPGYMLGFAIEDLNYEIDKIVREKGKSIWSNGPTSLEVMKFIDGLMAENSWHWLGTMQYYALNKPLILLQRCTSTYQLEDALKTAIVCGAQVHVTWEPTERGGNKENSKMLPDSNEENVDLINKYLKILDILKKRKWYLGARALTINNSRFKANIYQTENKFIVPISNDYVINEYTTIECILNIKEFDEIENVYAVYPYDKDNEMLKAEKIGEHKFKINVDVKSAAAIVIEQNNH